MLSDPYRAQLEHIHSQELWGVVGWTKGSQVWDLMRSQCCGSVLDYGSGHGSLARWFHRNGITVDLREYEPGIAAKSSPPEPADLVVCLDVMEHVEPQYVAAVLDHIQGLALHCVYFNIALKPAKRSLPDGRNAHLTQMPAQEWQLLLRQRWHLLHTAHTEHKLEWQGLRRSRPR